MLEIVCCTKKNEPELNIILKKFSNFEWPRLGWLLTFLFTERFFQNRHGCIARNIDNKQKTKNIVPMVVRFGLRGYIEWLPRSPNLALLDYTHIRRYRFSPPPKKNMLNSC